MTATAPAPATAPALAPVPVRVLVPRVKAVLEARRAHVGVCPACSGADGVCPVGRELDDLLTLEGALIQDARDRGHGEGVKRVAAVLRGDTIEASVHVYTGGVLTGYRPATLTVDRRPWMIAPDCARVSDGGRVEVAVASSIRIIGRAGA